MNAMQEGLTGWQAPACQLGASPKEARTRRSPSAFRQGITGVHVDDERARHDDDRAHPAHAQSLAVDSAPWQVPHRAGALIGSYRTETGRRDLRALETLDDGICLIDDGPEGALLVEPRLEQMAEVCALAADYLEQAGEHGESQVRHPWPPEVRDGDRS
jgi:hypothetical protein